VGDEVNWGYGFSICVNLTSWSFCKLGVVILIFLVVLFWGRDCFSLGRGWRIGGRTVLLFLPTQYL
jgi:hypothetical protein